jgi:transposase
MKGWKKRQGVDTLVGKVKFQKSLNKERPMAHVIMIGCDLHDRWMLIRFAVGDERPQQQSFRNNEEGRSRMIQYLLEVAETRQAKRIVFAYEASGQGYGLCDLLCDHGMECYVLSPTLLPKTPKSAKLKTDAKDAQMLLEQLRGHVLAGNPLPVVWTPPQRLRDDRELVRSRIDAAGSCSRTKLQILSMLKRRGIEIPKWYGGCWTRRWVAWLREKAGMLDAFVGAVLESLVERFEYYQREMRTLERHIRELARASRYAAAHDELRKIPGVGLLTAMSFLTEMGDLNRFENRRQVAAYLGLCPASFESGETNNRKGHITRQGPSRLRRILCQAAWSSLGRDPEATAAYERIKGGKAQRNKKALVALMRKLGIKMWHRAVHCGVSSELLGRGGPEHVRTSARAQQRGTVPFVSPSPRPLAGTG